MSDNMDIANAMARRAQERRNGPTRAPTPNGDYDPANELEALQRQTEQAEASYAQPMQQNGEPPPFTPISRYVWVVTKDKPPITFQGALIGMYGWTDQGTWIELRSASIAEVREDRPGEQYWVGVDGPALIPWHNVSHMYDMPPQQTMRPGAQRVSRIGGY